MKWFQHDTDASHDAKIRKLILKHGAIGYAVYFHCLELIAGTITQNNINFELEHDAEIIADNLKIQGDNDTSGIDKVNNIMNTIINLGLFTEEGNKIFCYKLALRLDNTVSRSPEINDVKNKLRINYVDTTKQIRLEENRTDKIRIDKSIENIDNIFNTWNNADIIKHKQSDKLNRCITNALKTYTESEMITAINNYSEVLHKPEEYFFKYKWTLRDFMARGIEKFMSMDVVKNNYLKKQVTKDRHADILEEVKKMRGET